MPALQLGGQPVTVAHLSAEFAPWARTGGLGEAVQGLATAQAATGTPVIAFVPLYRAVREALPDLVTVGDPFEIEIGRRRYPIWIMGQPTTPAGAPRVLFVDHPESFDRGGIYGEAGTDYADNGRRFAIFSRAAVEAALRLVDGPLVLHAHDWHAALAPVYLRVDPGLAIDGRRAAIVLTAHNAAYQGHFTRDELPTFGLPTHLFNPHQLEWYGRVNLLKGGLAFADAATTVSPTHADELRSPVGGFGLHGIFAHLGAAFVGIRNGIDADAWNPATDREITARFDAHDLAARARNKAALQRALGLPQKKGIPLFAFVGRLVHQKGVELLAASRVLREGDVQCVVLGSGDPRLERAAAELAITRPAAVAAQLTFSDRLEHRVMAGADVILMPSLFEPCGLPQLRAQRYGALVVARRVGGLADTVTDDETGFLFDEFDVAAFDTALERVVEAYAGRAAWARRVMAAMARDVSWASPVAAYADTYRRALEVCAAP